ncbi:hypothetical protein [Novosphingobium rosa]|uniref:hypothetical protein n=1 Tax=Novosphingobium rosa TaxID=76978 RepID=UPI00082EF455|nr:hypothetical protein [Novosphingobium rosa]
MTAHPRYSRPAPVDYARLEAPTAFRVWQGIESEDPPYEQNNLSALLGMAESMLATRQRRSPELIAGGAMDAESARAELAAAADLVTDWRWIVTGEGQPADAASLPARRELLDQALRTIAAIARERDGFSTALEQQGHLVIAMRWHLEEGRRTHEIAAFNHESRRIAAQAQQKDLARAA